MENENVLCALCGKRIVDNDKMADCYVYEFDGSLDYIQLAHADCAKDVDGWESD